MGRKTFWFWIGEFICVTAIAITLALSNINNLYIIIPIIFIIFLKYYQYQQYYREKYFTLRQQLDLLDSVLTHADRDLRCTYHVPKRRLLGNPQKLIQVIEYVPRGGGEGRTFPIDKGIVGRVYQQGGSRVENFDSHEAYRNRMVNEYGYSAREMEERTADRRSKINLNFNINCDTCLTSNQVDMVNDMKTHVKRLSEIEFDLLHQHGYEVADTTLFCYSPTLYSNTPYEKIAAL